MDSRGGGAAGQRRRAPPPRAPYLVEREGRRLLVRLLSDADRALLLFEEEPGSATAPGHRRLTSRERMVLAWVAQGKTNAEVGAILGISPRTAQKHLEHIFEKLGVETRTAAAALALGDAQFRREQRHHQPSGVLSPPAREDTELHKGG